jgi:hypothetical protein
VPLDHSPRHPTYFAAWLAPANLPADAALFPEARALLESGAAGIARVPLGASEGFQPGLELRLLRATP